MGKAVRCTGAERAQYLCLVMEETEEPAVTTSNTWRGKGVRGGEWNNVNHSLSATHLCQPCWDQCPHCLTAVGMGR